MVKYDADQEIMNTYKNLQIVDLSCFTIGLSVFGLD